MKNATFLILIPALLISLLGGCGQNTNTSEATGAPKDSLVISVGGMTDGNYDPCKGYGIYGYGIFHSALLKITNDIGTQCDLAIDYSISDDRLTYTFTIRDDIKFSDGEPLTPEDVVFTYNTAKTSGSSVDLTVLDKAEVIDGKVVFTLKKPYSPFIRTTALLGIVPEHSYNDSYAENPVGTGPFKVKQLNMGQQLIVEPNEYYYGVKSSFRQITFLSIDEKAALAAAKSGELDVVMVNPEYAREQVSGMRLEIIKTSDNRGFNLPCISEEKNAAGEIVGNNVTSDPAVRKALNIGVNRQKIIDNALNGIGTPSWVRFDGLPWANDEPAFEDGRVEEAQKLLEDAGWVDSDDDGVREKNGVRCEFTITGRTDDLQRYNLAVALSESAKELGINIKAEALDWQTCQKMSRQSPTCIGTGLYSYLDVYNAFHSSYAGIDTMSLSNNPMFSNETVDAYLDDMLAASSEEEAIALAKKAQYDGETGPNVDFPYIWLVNIGHTYFVADGLSIGEQRVHPHGHGEPVIENLNEWKYAQEVI